MKKLNNGNLKLAIQKDGRLTEDTIRLLRDSGLEFENYKQKLFSTCRNFPLNILYLRDDDIPDYVATGAVDLGIVGKNMLYETNSPVNIVIKLDYGYCSLSVAVPKESEITTISQLKNTRIATSYPISTANYFKNKQVAVELITINGSVEIAPALGMADAVADLVSTGSTLALNDLRLLAKIYDSQAVLITRKANIPEEKKLLIQKFTTRIRGVLSANNYKYVLMNAPENKLNEIRRKVPGLKSPTITPLATKGWISIQSVIREDAFWETIESLKRLGASDILVLPIEKLII